MSASAKLTSKSRFASGRYESRSFFLCLVMAAWKIFIRRFIPAGTAPICPGRRQMSGQMELQDKLFATARVPERQKSGRCPFFSAVQTWNLLPQLIGGTYIGDFEYAGFRNAIKNRVMFSWMEAAQERRPDRVKNPCLDQHYRGL